MPQIPDHSPSLITPDRRMGPAAGESLLVICTGNAARSVMAGYMLEHLAASQNAGRSVVTAGTHAVDGQPMSIRTRAAIASIPALAGAPVSRHRSRQLSEGDLHRAQLVVAMEADHVRYVRRRHPAAAGRTATIRVLARSLLPPPRPMATLPERLQTLALAEIELDEADDILDPAGKEVDAYLACAAELWGICVELMDRM